jgi:hypothetical protein
MTTKIAPRLSRRAKAQLDALAELFESQRVALEIAINDAHQKYRGETQMNPGQLFDLFVGGQTTTGEIAAQDLGTITRQIRELRQSEPDGINMTDAEIAQAILEYAREN